MDTETKINRRLVGFLLTPSWLSGIFIAFISLGVVFAIIVISRLSGSDLHQLYLQYQQSKPNSTANSYDLVAPTDRRYIFLSSVPLIAFWSLVGVVVYMLAANIITAIRNAKAVEEGLNYVNSNRATLIRTVILHFLARCAVVVLWLPYILFFLHWVIPYVLTAATAGGLLTVDGIAAAALSLIVLAVSLHLHVVFARLLLLKPRIFSRALYVA